MLISLISLSFIFFPGTKNISHAQNFSAAGVPFGGPIVMSVPCLCSGGQWILITDWSTVVPGPNPMALVFQYGYSKMATVQNYASLYKPGSQTLGTFTPGGTCLSGFFCLPLPVAGTITTYVQPGVGLTPTLGL